ncbi:MAG: radical SAM protein [Lachnospiraceae bacterium]|nr:radical SAM protein [Lachnospiraceae bacterium]
MLRHYLQWHIIHSCNLHCVHCYQEDYNCRMPYEQMVATLDKYEAYVRAKGYEGQINLTGGEPMLHPDFYRICEEIRRRGLRLGILTNGTLIDENASNKLAALKPVFVQISLDGPQKVHDLIRGEGNFQRAVAGIDHLKSAGVRVLVSFTIMKQNCETFREVARVCAKHHVDKLWWDRVVTDDESQYLTTEEFRKASETASRLSKKYDFINNGRALQWIPEDNCGYECSAGKRLLIILANGDMMACRRLPFVIGNIYRVDDLDSFLEENETMKMLRKPRFPKECVGCKYFYKCGGGSLCVTYAQTGKLGIRDVNCYL